MTGGPRLPTPCSCITRQGIPCNLHGRVSPACVLPLRISLRIHHHGRARSSNRSQLIGTTRSAEEDCHPPQQKPSWQAWPNSPMMVLVSPRRHTRRIALLLAPGVYAYPGNSCWRIVYGRCGINATTTVGVFRTFISTPVAFFRAHTLILFTGLDPVSYRVTHGLTLARAAPPFIAINQSQA